MSGEASLETQLRGDADEGKMPAATPWFADPKYNRFWAHYSEMKAWMNAHCDGHQTGAAHALQDFTANSWLQLYQHYYHNYQWWMHCHQYYQTASNPPYHTPSPSCHKQHSGHTPNVHQEHQHLFESSHAHHSKPHPFTWGYRSNQKYATDQSDVDHNGFSETPLDDDDDHGEKGEAERGEEEFEVELSEEMRQFFLQSQRHREELREMRLELSKKRDRVTDGGPGDDDEEASASKSKREMSSVVLDYEDEFEAKCPGSKKSKKKLVVGAPLEQPGKRRADEMKILYGKDSPAIHGMETAIQMQFDRNCDKKQPSHWPTVPFKM